MTRTIHLYGFVLTLVVVTAYLIHPRSIRNINNRATDAVMTFSKAKTVSGSVVIVDLDEKSLAQYGQWPWPRYRLAQLLSKINGLGAGSVGLDLILAEPDRTSPKNWQAAVGRELGYQVDISGIPEQVADHDRFLAETLAKGPFVLGYEFLFKEDAPKGLSCSLHPVNPVWVNSVEASQWQSGFFKAQGIVCNQKLFSDVVTFSGFLNATPDSDGILRRIPLLIRYEGRLYPSLALATLMQSRNVSQLHVLQKESGFLNLVAGGAVIPIDRHGNMVVNFGSGGETIRHVSAGDLLGNALPADSFKGKIVLVGSSAAGWAQVYQTPARPVHNHVDVHAMLLENLLTGQMVIRSQEFLIWEALFGFLASALLAVCIAKMEILGSALLGTASLLAIWSGAGLIFQRTGLLFSPLLPSTVILFNYAALTIIKTWKSQRAAKATADDTLVLLKASEHNLNSIIKSVPDIIFRLDATGRITFISPAITKYTDSPEQLIGHPIFDLVAPDDLPKAQYRLNEKRTGERATYGLEIRLLLPHKHDGNVEEAGYFSVSAEGIYRGETPCSKEFIGTQGIIRDITEQKRLEERLLHAQKMEAVGKLAAGVAHDLNNILAGLVTYPDLLLLELPGDSPIRDKVAIIQRSGQKAAAIVQDLLTLARRGVKVSEPVNLNRIISDYLASPEFGVASRYHSNITIETDLAPDLMNIKGSRVHLSKAIMNVLNNAAEAMPAGGTILLSSCNRYFDVPLHLYEEIPAGEYVCVSVADEGVGISDGDLKKIFEPFYSKKSMRRSGSGLGMTVIWATVKDHDGYIDLQSIEGEGTRIVMYFPVTRDREELIPHRIALEEYLGTEHVLVVDDMPEQIEIASKMLSKLGYRVATAASGEEAVVYLRSNKVDLVVLDMIMPGGMDGLETYKRIKEIHPGQRVIIASGFSESERVVMLQKLGAGEYVQKPYTLERFGVAVRKELDRMENR
ncbi:CHASE2 domain-containing protein [Geobacter sp. OR-1]|uniref:CHASE2 domain-containing protein n=1 Tax=Geobacter sp. OR-1 TaxID=1266765 RepID=UPI001364C650|nr:CHASE2 domain-containing protein [Geobacter sp. OR-1]